MLPVHVPELRTTTRHAFAWRQTLATTVALFVLIAAWDLSGLDLVMARWFGSPAGFALRDHWFWSTVLHEGARRVAWALQLVLLLAIWWPFGVLRRLSRRERAGMFVTAMLILLVISGFKTIDTTSCPWDLAEFGGQASYVSHWSWGVRDGGAGHCFPAGHASAAFCFLPGYFWLRRTAPRHARLWLAATLIAAMTLGLAQQVRGAHYLSHTLWTGWISWAVASLAHHGMPLRRRLRHALRRANHD
ncbi:MAG: phosphatase PAP2 family protein [Rhodoferax sp.]|nr:phosphatase PAP2 family protein [Rhodoferax sp.]